VVAGATTTGGLAAPARPRPAPPGRDGRPGGRSAADGAASAASWTAEIDWDPEIRWDQEVQSSCFFAIASSSSGEERIVAESREVEWPPTTDTGVHALIDAVDELERELTAGDWRPLEPADAWYARRFAWTGPAPPRAVGGRLRVHSGLVTTGPPRRVVISAAEARRERVAGILLGVAAIALGVVALLAARAADPGRMSGYGLPSVLPPLYYAAVAALIASFGVTLCRRRVHVFALGLHVAAAIAVIYGIAPLLEDGARTATAWKISGIADHIAVTGRVDTNIDAFFNWPAFFVLEAFFTRMAGFGNPTDYAAWAPVAFNALYVVPLYLLARMATSEPRAPWLAVWLFLLANWIGQDYLSPQAAAYFLFLVFMVILLGWFARYPGPSLPYVGDLLSRLIRSWCGQMERAVTASTPWQRVGLLAVAVTIVVAMVPSHQLTPFALGAVVTALVLAGCVTTRGLPAVVLTIAFVWLSYMAVVYLQGHFEQVVAPIGSISENVSTNYVARLQGSPEHVVVTYVRSATSLLVWLLAVAGAVRTARNGRLDLASVVMAATPFALIPFQAYGGELLLRIYVFTLAPATLLAALALLPRSGSHVSVPAMLAIVGTSLAVFGGSFLSRYGDERMHYFSPGEKAAVRALYDVAAPPPARLVAVFGSNVPWRFRFYSAYKYDTLENVYSDGGPPAVIRYLRRGDRRTYLIVTRSQLARGEITAGWTSRTWPELKQALLTSGTIRQIYANRDGAIYDVDTTGRG
jgi:hypothetical protein